MFPVGILELNCELLQSSGASFFLLKCPFRRSLRCLAGLAAAGTRLRSVVRRSKVTEVIRRVYEQLLVELTDTVRRLRTGRASVDIYATRNISNLHQAITEQYIGQVLALNGTFLRTFTKDLYPPVLLQHGNHQQNVPGEQLN